MSCCYRRLSEEEREEISRGLAKGQSLREIAKFLGRMPSTLSREIRRGGCNKYLYRAIKSQKRSLRNSRKRKRGKRKLALNGELREYVFDKLRLKWSPEQIAQIIRKEYPYREDMRISHEAIYGYLYVLPRGELKQGLLDCLRQKHLRRRKRRGFIVPTERKIANMLSIEERPKEVEDRIIPGHWEGDLIIGKNRQSALGTLVERTTRTVILIPLKNRTAEEVRKAFAKEALKLPKQMRLSMTYDQGREMAEHTIFTKMTGVLVYFAHPASPWERGTNENTNGLIRQFFPKGTDFSKVSKKEIKHAQDLLNGRPRKVLDWDCPYKAFERLAGVALKA